MADEDDRFRDASGGAGAGWSDPDQLNPDWADTAAPDDIRELTRDVHAYHRERRRAHRRELIERFSARPGAAPVTITIGLIAMIAIAAMLISLVSGGSNPKPVTALPLYHSAVPTATRGGLLPSVTLRRADGVSVNSQSLRPGVVALLPPNCNCSNLIASLNDSAAAAHFKLFAVVPGAQSADADAIAGQIPIDQVFTDSTAALLSAFNSANITIVVVNRNGTIYRIHPNVDDQFGATLKADLVQILLHPGITG